MYAVKLGTQLDIYIIKNVEQKPFHDFCCAEIGCDCVERVRPRGLRPPFVLMMDESGALKEKPVINFIASYLYGTHEHKHPICGDVLIVAQDGPNVHFLTEDQAWQISGYLRQIAFRSFNKVREALGDTIQKEA